MCVETRQIVVPAGAALAKNYINMFFVVRKLYQSLPATTYNPPRHPSRHRLPCYIQSNYKRQHRHASVSLAWWQAWAAGAERSKKARRARLGHAHEVAHQVEHLLRCFVTSPTTASIQRHASAYACPRTHPLTHPRRSKQKRHGAKGTTLILAQTLRPRFSPCLSLKYVLLRPTAVGGPRPPPRQILTDPITSYEP